MITLKDVAQEAGVSIATVSCALSGKKAVRPETYARIMDAVEKLKYIPNYSARNLKKKASNMVSVLLPGMRSQFYAGLFDGISSCLQSQGYSINIAFSNDSADVECTKIDEFITQNSAGLIIMTAQPGNTAFFQNHIMDYQIPTVFVEREPDSICCNYVGFRHYDTFYGVVSQLLEKGYRDIGIACGSLEFSSERSYVQACRDIMEAEGEILAPDRICETNFTREDAFNSFMKYFSKNPPEVLLSTSREITYGIQTAMEYCGLRTPEDVVLISCSEESWINISQNDGVLKLSRNSTSLGEEAAKILLKNIQNPGLYEQTIREINFSEKSRKLNLPPKMKKQNSSHRTAFKEKIRFLAVDNPTIRALQLLTGHFEEETGIGVEFHCVPQDQLFSMISDSTDALTQAYDFYTYDVPWLEYMVQNMCLADISSFIESDDFRKEKFFQTGFRNCQVNGRYFGIPVIGGTQLLFYRKDLFESRELQAEYQKRSLFSLRAPRTWKEFNDVAAFFTREKNPSSPTVYGASFAGAIDEELAPEILIRLWACGGSLWDNYHRPTFHTKENRMAFESILQTIGYIPQQDMNRSITQTVDDFCAGRTAMLITYSEFAYGINRRVKENVSGRVAASMIPGKTPASVGWNLGLNPFSTHRDAVFQFFSWLCSSDTNLYLTILNGASASMEPYHNSELLKLYPWLSSTEESLHHSRRRNSPYRKNRLIIPVEQIERILCQALRSVYQGNTSIEEALREAQKEADHLFRMYGYPTVHEIFRK